MLKKIFYFFLFTILITSCGKKKEVVDNILLDQDIEKEMISSYREGYEALKKGDLLLASRKFNDAEILYPQSKWAAKASLMSSYALYAATYYSDAIFYLERHIKKYPKVSKEIIQLEDKLQSIQKEKPNGIKGDFVVSSFITSTMGVSHKLKVKI